MNELEIRPYNEQDEQAIVDLWIACGLVTSWNDPRKDIARKMKVNPEWFLVGELDGEVIVSCMAGYEGHRGWVNYLAVSPEYQRRGYAAMMMRKAEELLLAAGCPKVNLQVRENNHGVIRFYESIGYKRDAVVSFGRRLIPDQLDMEKDS